MSLPILIIGGSSKGRKGSAEDFAAKHSSTFDTTILDTREASGIGDVRNINKKLALRPYESSSQTVIVLEAQNLTIEAQNALLKNLEETPEAANIILTSPTAESLLSTVASRCQKMQLPIGEEETSWGQLEDFFQGSFYQRYISAASLNLDSWLDTWRKILRAGVGIGSPPFIPAPEHLRRILNYVKLLCKLRSLIKRKASPKLLKTIILLEAPFAAINRKAVNNS